MGLNLDYTYGQTPIDREEREGLKIKTISNREELNEFEQLNIEKAMKWVYKKSFSIKEILSEEFIKKVHKQMFADVWRWAGEYRTTNKNIGVDKFLIPMKIINLLNDCSYWIDNKIFPNEEICIRFKHKLVSIHLFPNGNGRHSRLMADILVEKVFHSKPFSWGRYCGVGAREIRENYIQSLQKADSGNYSDLIAFAKS